MSTPTTPTRSKRDIPDSSPTTRIQHSLFDGLTGMIAAIEDTEPIEPVKETLEKMKDSHHRIGPANPLQGSQTSIECHAGFTASWDAAHLWQPPEGPEVHLSASTMTILRRMHDAKFWRRDSSETLSRTLINLVLFDRLEAHQEELAAKQISIRGGYPVETRVPNGKEIITGNADYALGYGSFLDDPFECICVIIQVKDLNVSRGSTGISQAVTYMMGLQPQCMSRKNPKTVDTVYGVVSDGVLWQFLRLNGNLLQLSGPFVILSPAACVAINQFLDYIVRSAISLSQYPVIP
ncbi:hypothetical protein DTO207G8_4045 [Paecilomyces variotii]|nr:hypothetical protein DTO169E5_7721 [Paecilomyces variotii]KAJ9253621.1 hypothetical protein DTO207G8_4045 [Paecilomyces variotii]